MEQEKKIKRIKKRRILKDQVFSMQLRASAMGRYDLRCENIFKHVSILN